MTTYAVGDIQGCLTPLKELLEQVKFDPANDKLLAVGDLVNRGPESLETLRFCYQLGNSFKTVLGNHDLHLLAIAHGERSPNRKDTLNKILSAPDREELLHWLQQQPILLEDSGYVIVHAGIPPIWSLKKAKKLAAEVEAVFKDKRAKNYFKHMYGDNPANWSDEFVTETRWRVITNYFTRMRFCTVEGKLDLTTKSAPENPPEGFLPWFEHHYRKTGDVKIIFGHWAALEGRKCGPNLFPLDTGYVWGGPLRMMNLETGEFIHQY
ncbi:MAG: symmetrical bis(5'-nucleosyl)-tetraphosphatase [Porticoccaceae bacterium]|nr:symmetrical bis(5'-nucleosyl)-tetraphosphatase [Pseudomonadales bacterium]MCP5172738.1 symmetrical bis(5'-nucleosyl)-tetraphosphatase [Pseudomonadales bacterium]MCP5302212.1 symmetrical bis(5'-nucleosyl)-tetraphosphatase [Pseudomonadales bacterium]